MKSTKEFEIVVKLCKQAGKLLKKTRLPQHVNTLFEVFPYAASIACAHGMWHILHEEQQAGPFHEDRIMFSAWNALGHRLDIGESLEPYPFEAFYYNSCFGKEIVFCFALGMMYEMDYLSKAVSIWERYDQLFKEYEEWDIEYCPTMSHEVCSKLKRKYDEEIETFWFAIGRVPDIVWEKKKAVEHCYENIQIHNQSNDFDLSRS